MRADVAEDAAELRGIPEPRWTLRWIDAMRPESDRLHDLADRSLLHEIAGANRRCVLESFTVENRIDALRLRLDASHFGQLLERRDARLVRHVVLAGAHHTDAERRPLVRHDRRHHEVDRGVVENGVLVGHLFRVRIVLREVRGELRLFRMEGHELAAAADHRVHLSIDVRVVHPDHGEPNARCARATSRRANRRCEWIGDHRGRRQSRRGRRRRLEKVSSSELGHVACHRECGDSSVVPVAKCRTHLIICSMALTRAVRGHDSRIRH